MRCSLPLSLRNELVRRRPAAEFARRVGRGIFDEYVGMYRFDRRPDLVVRIERRNDQLISYGGGQSDVLASLDDEKLMTAAYDGEGQFRRDQNGRVTHFIYYEFGKRLGIASKIAWSDHGAATDVVKLPRAAGLDSLEWRNGAMNER